MRAVGGAIAIATAAGCGPGVAQDTAPQFIAPGGVLTEFPVARSRTPLLTLDQERLFVASAFGRRVAAELAAASEQLARQNRAIEAALTEEERDLTERRASLSAEEFRALADAFDEKVVGFRRAQDSKARALQRRDDAERQAFLRAVVPILSELVAELGAVAILDNRAVLFAADSIDVTDRAIARIDATIGAGDALSPPGPILPVDEGPGVRPEGSDDAEAPDDAGGEAPGIFAPSDGGDAGAPAE